MQQKEDSFLKLKKQIKDKNLENLYLFFGEEAFVKDLYLNHMVNLLSNNDFSDFNRIFLDGKSFDAEKIDSAIDSFPVMSDKKIVVVKDSGIFKSKSDLPQDAIEFWVEKLKNLPDFTTIIFDEYDVDKRSGAYKTVSKHGLAVEFCYLKPYELAAWVVREAQKSGKKISKSAAEHLLELCDPGLNNVKNELLKLFNYCGDEIYESDIDKVVSKPMSVIIFDITDAILNGNRDEAVKILLKLQENKTSAFNILYLLSSNFDRLLRCKLLLAEGATLDTVAAKLKLSPYVAKKYIADCKGFSEDFLTTRICKTAEYDLKIKQGLIDEKTALFGYVFDALNVT